MKLRQTKYDFLTKKVNTFSCLLQLPKSLFKVEVNKAQAFIAPCFSSLYRGGHSVKSQRKFYVHTFLEPFWMKKVIIYNFWLQTDKDSVFSIKRAWGVLCFISKRKIECFVKLYGKLWFFFINSTGGVL